MHDQARDQVAMRGVRPHLHSSAGVLYDATISDIRRVLSELHGKGLVLADNTFDSAVISQRGLDVLNELPEEIRPFHSVQLLTGG